MPNTKPSRELSRREFLSATGTLAVAARLSAADNKGRHQRGSDASQMSLRWLDGQVPACMQGTTWGTLRSVVKIEGRHVSAAGRAWLPFTLRLYFYAGAQSVRLMHTFVFDGDEQKDFIRGLGLRFDVPMHDEPHDRHIRFAGEDKGLWAEAVRNLSGLRREPPASVVADWGNACRPTACVNPIPA